MDFKPKYFGALKNFDFENINKDNFEFIIASGVFEEFDLSSDYQNDKDYFTSENDIMSFGYFFIHNRKQYEIKKDIIHDIIYVQNWYLNAFAMSDVDAITNQIDVLVLSELNLESKLNLLESEYKKYFNKISNKELYPLFHNNTYSNGYKNWENYLYDEIIEDEKFDIIVSFLQGIYDFLPAEIYNKWVQYFIFSKISNHIEKNKNSLLNIKPKTMEETPNNSTKNIDLNYQLALIEEIVNLENQNKWKDLSTLKKGKVLSLLLGKNKDNISKYYQFIDKPLSEIPEKILADRLKATNEINEILG